MTHTVVIPTAGIGSRLGKLTKFLNKSLISVSNKPSISHIIEKFPKETDFIIPVGYKSNLVREFLELAHPDLRFQFIEVSPFSGEGSGLGLSLLSCKQYLQKPFIFISCDSLVREEIPLIDKDWMGFGKAEKVDQFRKVYIDKSIVLDICEKNIEATKNHYPYVGIAGIHSYEEFWSNMDKGGNEAIEVGESFGLKGLLPKKIEAIEFSWNDTGSLDGLEKANKEYYDKDSPNILKKENETIWFVNNKVIKFSDDINFIKNRILRAEKIKEFIPKIVNSKRNMYSYEKVEGLTLSKAVTKKVFKDFLKFSERFFEKISLSNEELKSFRNSCNEFYKIKTFQRVDLFLSSFQEKDLSQVINGQNIPKVKDLLDNLDWNYLSEGEPSRFHGDYHFENVIWSKDSNKFTLLDWRQEFAGSIEIGDVYYDLAKLLHGLIISHEIIDKGYYEIKWDDNKVDFDFLRNQKLILCERLFYDWLDENGYDGKKVKILTSLIFLNIAALHHNPYSHLLFALGKMMLNDEING